MVTTCVIVPFATFPGNGLFFTFAEFVSVSWCDSRVVVSTNHVRNDLHVSQRCHVTVLVRLKETIEGTDCCKLRVIAHIKSNLQCFLLDQSAKGLFRQRLTASLDNKICLCSFLLCIV